MVKTLLTYGDTVVCRVRGNSIVSGGAPKWDAELEFKVIGYSFVDEFYIIFIPRYYDIKNSWVIEDGDLAEHCIKKHYKGKKGMAVQMDKIFKVKTPNNRDGVFCVKCGRFYDYAEPNQEDGTMICFSCRSNPYQMSKPNKIF
jgi:hypothetical protein